MRHTFTVEYNGTQALGTFEYHYRNALMLGGTYFEFCEDHAGNELEIEIHRYMTSDDGKYKHSIIYLITWDDGKWDDDDEFDDDDDDPDPNPQVKAANVDPLSNFPFFSCPSLGLTAVILPNPEPSMHGV